jgi:ribokinase
MKKRYDVITLGSGTIDVFANTEAQFTKKSGKEMITYPTGSKILIKELKFEVGGGGTNTAISFSRLGLKTAWIGKVGNDQTSDLILDYMKKNKIDFLGKKGISKSGFSVILDSIGHDRTILTHKGDNDTLTFQEIQQSKLSTKWFYFSSMMGKSFDTQKKLAVFAQKNGSKVAFNPSSYQAALGKKKLNTILKNTNLLVLNFDEAKILLETKEKKLDKILKGLCELGPDMVVVTDGKKGAYCYDKKFMYTIYPHNLKVIETTGAGDAFASSFLSGIIKKNDVEYALKLGLANSESIIRHYGAKNILLTTKQAEIKMKKPTKIIKKKI